MESIRGSWEMLRRSTEVKPKVEKTSPIVSESEGFSMLELPSNTFSNYSTLRHENDNERVTPQPRQSVPYPQQQLLSPIQNNFRISKENPLRTSLNQASYANLVENPQNKDIQQHYEWNQNDLVPSQIILAQQMQIQEVRQQLDELRGLVIKLSSNQNKEQPNENITILKNEVVIENKTPILNESHSFKVLTKDTEIFKDFQYNKPKSEADESDISKLTEETEDLWKPLIIPTISNDITTESKSIKSNKLKNLSNHHYFMAIPDIPALRSNENEAIMMETGINSHRAFDKMSSFPYSGNQFDSQPSYFDYQYQTEQLSCFMESEVNITFICCILVIIYFNLMYHCSLFLPLNPNISEV